MTERPLLVLLSRLHRVGVVEKYARGVVRVLRVHCVAGSRNASTPSVCDTAREDRSSMREEDVEAMAGAGWAVLRAVLQHSEMLERGICASAAPASHACQS